MLYEGVNVSQRDRGGTGFREPPPRPSATSLELGGMHAILAWFTLACAYACFGATAVNATAPSRPNVLYVVVDDLRPELPVYGQSYIHAPNVERLAGRGVVFDHAYAQQAVSKPHIEHVQTSLPFSKWCPTSGGNKEYLDLARRCWVQTTSGNQNKTDPRFLLISSFSGLLPKPQLVHVRQAPRFNSELEFRV